ncbi:winged helix-turn-helix transcriptional regulator [Curvibacter sp. CHRR-16]|uniref:ArsR/SmtB family transcription factor n=1 Tax=Curvibacter sp. CHRR-16 TaxID=2835872 RepID=UPI001BD9CAA5|nr:metalloregulator ArsR/SmtB family transcription factor [Curvibacter sp. CHRR-16]MBT0569310.1 winged helix-turn-helix transcriptional regulator [Curvibacter sp. CHRR-16]
MDKKTTIRALAALAQDVRLDVFRALVVAGEQGLTPGDMAESLGVPATGLSFHLKELMNAGLIAQERQGRNLRYRAEFTAMNELLAYLTENCCQGQSCGAAAPNPCHC